MEKMRQAGFSILFIGVESVNQNSLLETAKVQNDQALAEAVMKIQSYGFVIAPGFIFGFDSDTETMFDDTLSFMENTGIIGGDPSFLMALPGTPLFARMKQTGRLVSQDSPTVRMKITTNIRYLLDSEFLIKGFLDFLTKYGDARFQYRRFAAHIENMAGEGRYIGHEGGGYGSPKEYLQFQMKDSANRKMLMARIGFLLHKPSNLLTAIRAWLLYRKHAPRLKGLAVHFNYWIYVWTNIGIKYWGLKESDFLLHSVGRDFDFRSLLNYDVGEQKVSTETLKRGDEKVAHQSRFTNKALQMLVTERQKTASS